MEHKKKIDLIKMYIIDYVKRVLSPFHDNNDNNNHREGINVCLLEP